jgi:hypothetical protein
VHRTRPRRVSISGSHVTGEEYHAQAVDLSRRRRLVAAAGRLRHGHHCYDHGHRGPAERQRPGRPSPSPDLGSDAGCVAAENDARSLTSTITADDNAISRDQGNTSAEQADIRKFITDLRALQSELDAAQAEARYRLVKAAIGVMSSDLGIVVSDLQAVQRGDTSKVSQLDAAAGRLQGDGSAIDSVCSKL